MAVRIKFDNTHNAIQPTFVLATRSGKRLGSVPAYNISITDNFNSSFELSFCVQKYNNGVKYHLWEHLKDFKLLWCREYNVWFEIYVEISEENDIVKNISCKSLGECELSQINLYGLEINTEDDIEREDYKPTILFDSENKSSSLLHRILQKAPHYTVKHVDLSIKSIQRTFLFDGCSIYDAFQQISTELDCIFVINSGMNSDNNIAREISVYDLESYCLECGERGNFDKKCSKCGSTNILSGYGNDTTIFVSSDNLADNISYKTDVDSVKNCFKLEAGDDLMTATIANCNPNGSPYIWYISDELKKDMSDELVSKLNEYDESYNYYQNDYTANLNQEKILSKYNELVEKYSKQNEDLKKIPTTVKGYPALMNAYYETIDMQLYLEHNMMPDVSLSRTTAALQAARLGTNSISPVAVMDITKCSGASASNAVLAVAKTIVDPRYQVKIKDSVYTDTVWTGSFVVTNYSDDTDTATSVSMNIYLNDDFETYVLQMLQKSLSKTSDEITNISDLFKLSLSVFKTEIKKYCLERLRSFHDACQACINILIEQGISNDKTYINKENNLYSSLYIPYYDKLQALEDEMKLRESEISVVIGIYDSDGDLSTHGLQTLIDKEQIKIQDILNIESFLGEELWIEFVAYRREDTYSNDNYISDGLDNSELFNKALEFIKVANKDIYKSATLQHSISSTLKNLLAMKEFKPIVDYFEVGNWIRVKIDGETYKLRLLSYEIDYESLDELSVTFSDVKRAKGGFDDSESVLNQAASMSTSYGSVSRQANQGKKSNQKLDDWVTKGLSLTKIKIIDNADNQNITWDSHGLLCKEYLPITDDYDEKQLKIINRGLYLTDDNWKTSKAGIGDFVFYNPKNDKMEEAYGVIADTLVGNLILSENVGVYNTKNSITMDENGLTITTEAKTDGTNTMALTVQRKTLDENNNEILTPVMYLDGDGNLVMTGSLRIQAASDTSVGTLNDLCDINRFGNKISDAVHAESQKIYSSIDERYKDIIDEATSQLENYKADLGQYIQFNNDGLTLGALTSNFKTIIDNRGVYFKEGGTTVAYINNHQLYIPNAVIENALILGKFFFNPHSNNDGGVSLTWQGEHSMFSE